MFWRKRSRKDEAVLRHDITSGLIVGNWKCHKSFNEAKAWFERFAAIYEPKKGLRVVVAPSMLCLEQLADYVQSLNLSGVSLAAQNVSPFPKGSYTGEVSADMLKGLVDYAIIGHYERRLYFKETSRMVTNKAEELIEADITPIICVDEDIVQSQLTALNQVESQKPMVVAYSPVEALNFRIAEEPSRVQRMAEAINRNKPKWPVIYGGAVDKRNCTDYLALEPVSGIFVGSASLDPEGFAAICSCIG